MDGKKICKECPLFETDACGGKNILASGRNQKGYTITEEGLSPSGGNPSGNPASGKKSKKKKK
jgi:hypothetical protein